MTEPLSVLTGEPLAEFTLPALDGIPHRLSETLGRVTVLNFWSAECPWSERTDGDALPHRQAWGPVVVWWAIAANTNEPSSLLQQIAALRHLPLVLQDAGHVVADRLGALTTPHCFVLDRQGILRYQGAYDDVTFRQRSPSRVYLVDAVEALLAGRLPDPAQTPPYGCTIVRM